MDQSYLPPEILAHVFELGFYAWGIQFLRPLFYVCKYWHGIIEGTPQLWSTIVVDYQSPESFDCQIRKAKESPLSISLPYGLNRLSESLTTRLISLSHNWRHANLTTSTFALCRWANLCINLKELRLSRGKPADDDPRDFFGDPDTHLEIKLRSFTALQLPKAWVLGLIGPSIRQFCFRGGWGGRTPYNIFDTFQYLSRINGAAVIDLENIYHSTVGLHTLGVAHLNNLQALRLFHVSYTPALLCSISAPSLQTLYIECTDYHPHNETMPMAPFFSQWSQPGFVPVNLHTLKLVTCLKVTDVPFLIRWLAHLPNIVRLFIRDGAIDQAATMLGQDTDHANLYKALASPLFPTSTVGGWLCPSLTFLQIFADGAVADLIPIARARGGIATPDLGIPSPSRLCRIEAVLCLRAESGERELLESLLDQAICICCREHVTTLYANSRLIR